MPESTDPSRTPGQSPVDVAPMRPYIGGQAVLEGVMMRAPTSLAIVVRRRDGSLHVRERAMADSRKGFTKLPFIRGMASLGESLRLGSEALRFSAEQMERDFEAEEAEAKAKAAKGGVGTSMLSVLRTIGYTLFLLTTADGDAASPASSKEPSEPSRVAARVKSSPRRRKRRRVPAPR